MPCPLVNQSLPEPVVALPPGVISHIYHPSSKPPDLPLQTSFPTHPVRRGKRHLALPRHIERKDMVVDIVRRSKPRARGQVRSGGITYALQRWRVRVGEDLQRGAAVVADLLEELQAGLDRYRVADLVEQDAEGGAVFEGLAAALALD